MEEKKLTDELAEMYVSGKFNGEIIFNAIKTIYALQEKNAEQKAEIERLTEELKVAERNLTAESRNYESSNHIVGLLKDENAELQKQVDDWVKVHDEQLHCMQVLTIENNHLQKQVDELTKENKWLTKENEELYNDNTTLIAGSILQKEQVEKDTTKEIYFKVKHESGVELSVLNDLALWIKDRFGVAVEKMDKS